MPNKIRIETKAKPEWFTAAFLQWLLAPADTAVIACRADATDSYTLGEIHEATQEAKLKQVRDAA